MQEVHPNHWYTNGDQVEKAAATATVYYYYCKRCIDARYYYDHSIYDSTAPLLTRSNPE